MGDHLVVEHWARGVHQRKDVHMLLAMKTKQILIRQCQLITCENITIIACFFIFILSKLSLLID